tara:strand:- start:2970 stop:3854 length:885 start_codon:yes stop_codon:yes gene_type:complete
MAKKIKTVGIVLAGGRGSRLYPSTKSISKQLLPIYDKPLIYYPLSILMLADIREILIICDKSQLNFYKDLCGDGSKLGIEITYRIQENPKGIVDAFSIGEEFIGENNVCLVLGDNILWGQGLSGMLLSCKKNLNGAKVFGYQVDNPEEFGVLNINRKGIAIDIDEKPTKPKSNFAVPGIYFYDNSVLQMSKKVKPSARGELEITDLNKLYIRAKKLEFLSLGRGFAWLDTGSPELMLEASNFVRTIEKRQGTKIACLEEIAFKKGWVSKKSLVKYISNMPNSDYVNYLKKIILR